MRILFVARAPFISGAERSMQLTILALQNCGAKISMLCPQSSPLVDWGFHHGIDVVTCRLFSTKVSSAHLTRLFARVVARVIGRRPIDIVHCNQVWSNLWAVNLAKALGVPAICHMRDYVSADGLRWLLSDRPQGIVCVSRHLHAYIEAHGFTQGIPTITLGGPSTISSTNANHMRIALREKFRKDLGIATHCRVVLYAGQFINQKGLHVLCEAAEQVNDRNIYIILVGSAPSNHQLPKEHYTERLIQLVQRNRIKLIGRVTDMTPYYSSADLVVVPSLEEPLARVVLEAASFGVPAIIADVDGLSESFTPHITGWPVRAGDSQALAQVLEQTYALALAEYGERARVFVQRNYEAKWYAQRLLEFYACVLSQWRSGKLRH